MQKNFLLIISKQLIKLIMSITSQLYTPTMNSLVLNDLIIKIEEKFNVKVIHTLSDISRIEIKSINCYIDYIVETTHFDNLMLHNLGNSATWFCADEKSQEVMTFIAKTLGGYLDIDDCDMDEFVYYPIKQIPPVVNISLEDFVVKYEKDVYFEYLEDLKIMVENNSMFGNLDSDFIQKLVNKYASIILPTPEFSFYIDDINGTCHLSFPYQVKEALTNVSLQSFHFTKRFNLNSAEDVFNLICDFQLEVQRVRHNLDFKNY